MKDLQLYQQILGLETPWQVKNVEIKPKEQQVLVEKINSVTNSA